MWTYFFIQLVCAALFLSKWIEISCYSCNHFLLVPFRYLWSGLSSVTFGQTINKCLTLHNTCCLNCPSCQSPQVDPAWSLPTLPYLTNTECFVHLLWNMYNSCKYFLLIFSKDKWVFVGSFRFMYIYILIINQRRKKKGYVKWSL